MTGVAVLFVSAALGSYLRLLFDKGIRDVTLWPFRLSREAAMQMFVAGLSMAVIGQVPLDVLGGLAAEQIPAVGPTLGAWLKGMAGLGTYPETASLVGILAGYAGLDLAWLLRQRLPWAFHRPDPPSAPPPFPGPQAGGTA